MKVYFDNAATTIVRDEAIEAMLRVMREKYGNPSSMHHMGRRAASELAAARKNVADALGARPDDVYFTSGGTEANNWAMFGAENLARKPGHIITSAIEHDAVMAPLKRLESFGWEITYLMPDGAGRISAESFSEALREDTVFASVMLVNNETGAVNPLGEYSKEIKRRGLGTVLHTDAVQGFCKIPFTLKALGVDIVSVSAHKMHGPKGAGALYIRDGLKLSPLLLGGSQERGKRPGTEVLPAAAGFGASARLGRLELEGALRSVRKLHKHAVHKLSTEIPCATVIGDGDCPFIISLSLPGHKSEVLMSFLDGEGICVSKSSACRKGGRSRVLEAMRLQNDVIDGAIRVSFSRFSTLDEVEYFIKTLKRASETLLRPG